VTESRAAHAQVHPVARVKGQQVKGSRSGSHAVIKKSTGAALGGYESLKAIE